MVIPDEVIAQIHAAPTETLGSFKKELGQAWKQLFPITPMSIKTEWLIQEEVEELSPIGMNLNG